jgi:hypothetical protein
MCQSGCELAQGAGGALVGDPECVLAELGLRLMACMWPLGEGRRVLVVLRNVHLHPVQLVHPLHSSWGTPVEVQLVLEMVLGMQRVRPRLPMRRWLPMPVLGVRVRLDILHEGGRHASRVSTGAGRHR